MPDRPNVLMVIADQHHAGLMRCAGHHQVISPNLDAFAASGIRFTNAYAANTICTPNRISVFSGQYPHNHRYYGLSGPTNFGLDNFMRHFRRHGYRTAAYGKLHLPESPRNWLADDLDEFGDSYETVDGVFGKSAYLDELERLGLRNLEDSWKNLSGTYSERPMPMDAGVSLLPYEHTQEVWSARQAMDFIDAAPGTSFCIQVAFQRPHQPWLPQRQFWDLYPEDLELPPTHDLPASHRPPNFRGAWYYHHERPWEYAAPDEPIEVGHRRHWRGALACITQVDDIFGMLMRFLEERGLTENTIVIYLSDHGGYHGIHGIREKAPGICSDAVCRIPMLWRVPGVTRAGATHPALIQSVDLAPTLASLGGLPPMEYVDGCDLTPALRGDQTTLREVAVTENVWSKSLRWGRWRFVHYQRATFSGDDEGELYDLEDDPNETRNLYHDPESQPLVHEARRLLLEWLIETSRAATVHPPVRMTGSWQEVGKCEYPVGSDGTAPNDIQPRFNPNRSDDYI